MWSFLLWLLAILAGAIGVLLVAVSADLGGVIMNFWDAVLGSFESLLTLIDADSHPFAKGVLLLAFSLACIVAALIVTRPRNVTAASPAQQPPP